MKTLRFEGHSDDTFGEYGVYDEDHDNCADGEPITFRVSAGIEGLYVIGQYAGKAWPGGVWMIGVAQLDEDVPLPTWSMRFETSGSQYSPVLVIEAPDSVVVELWQQD
jgi:hypothetical protein